MGQRMIPSSDLNISIALATFNGERYLREQLASLAAQTCQPFELVVVDDGSKDRTIEIVKNFAATVRFPVRIFRNDTRLGYRSNFMRAAELCGGELIAFCDQDDIWASEKLEVMKSEFNDPEVLLAFHNAKLTDANGLETGFVFKATESAGKLSALDVEIWKIVPGFSQVIRRSLMRYSTLHKGSVDFFDPDERMPHDQWFMFLATTLGKVAYVAQTLALYRQHRGNTSGWIQARPLAFALHNIVHASFYVRAAFVAIKNRVELLRLMRHFAPAEAITKIDEALVHCEHASTHIERRMRLYSAKSIRVRIGMLLSLVRNRAYSGGRITFDAGSIWLDSLVGVTVGHRLRY
jgi:glycosyltransferase involved in cell wall biosynthesis